MSSGELLYHILHPLNVLASKSAMICKLFGHIYHHHIFGFLHGSASQTRQERFCHPLKIQIEKVLRLVSQENYIQISSRYVPMTWFRSIMKVFGLKNEIPIYLNDDHNSAYRAFDTNYGTQEILNLTRISTFLQNYAPNRFYYF